MASSGHNELTHWGRVTHICIGKLTNIGSDNGLSPGRRRAIIWTNAGTLLIGPLGTNFSEFFIVIHTFSFNKMHLKMSSTKWCPFCLGLNVLSNGKLHCVLNSLLRWTTKKSSKPFITGPLWGESLVNYAHKEPVNVESMPMSWLHHVHEDLPVSVNLV